MFFLVQNLGKMVIFFLATHPVLIDIYDVNVL